jgi:RNA polymerase sigma-70 factor, ECF subfamily
LQSIFNETWRGQALKGDRAAIQTLLQKNLQPLFAFCLYRVGRNRHWCEEVVQETMLSAWRGLADYDPIRAEGNILPWLTGLARNEIQRLLERENSAVSLQSLWENLDPELLAVFARLESEPFDDALLERAETRDLVNAAMSQLPDHYRDTLEAKYVLGQSLREIAELAQVSEKAVESQLVRARKAFRATFEALSRHLQTERQPT